MNGLEQLRTELKPLLDSVNDTIRQSLVSKNKLLSDIISFFLNRKGKQIRPVFTFLIAKLLGEPNNNTIKGAAATELLHNASLIHDDVVDNSEMRRNADTLNKIWDNQISVLVGDYIITAALDQALETNNLMIVKAISTLGRQLAVGELDQIYNAQNNSLNEDAYIKMIELKTASLFVTCARMAALSVQVSDDDLQKVCDYARLLGICFQIKDDIFDYYVDGESVIGKPVEADLLEKKISLPLLHVLIEDQNKGNNTFIDICFKDDLSTEDIKILVEHAVKNGGIEYAQSYMEKLYQTGQKILSDFSNKEAIRQLDLLFRYVIDRDR